MISTLEHRARTGSFHSSCRARQHGPRPSRPWPPTWPTMAGHLPPWPWPPCVTLASICALIANLVLQAMPYSPFDGLTVLMSTISKTELSMTVLPLTMNYHLAAALILISALACSMLRIMKTTLNNIVVFLLLMCVNFATVYEFRDVIWSSFNSLDNPRAITTRDLAIIAAVLADNRFFLALWSGVLCLRHQVLHHRLLLAACLLSITLHAHHTGQGLEGWSACFGITPAKSVCSL